MMDFSKVETIRIALKFSYIGKNYNGLVVQDNTSDTVEARLFEALRKCCLINPDPQSKIANCVYTRCGRTDKGVSALANVCSLIVRKLPNADYCSRINHCLPHDIRILAYAEIPPHFDARFSCMFREYKYFFFRGDLDLNLVREAATKLVGMHDFRNFCKKDESAKFGFEAEDGEDATQNYMRRIYSFRIVEVSQNKFSRDQDVCMAVIKGSAFLWHQVRCMMAVLFLIGSGTESLDIIRHLFDVDKIKDRPNYDIADGANLVLSDCGFEGVKWRNANFYADLETFNVVKT